MKVCNEIIFDDIMNIRGGDRMYYCDHCHQLSYDKKCKECGNKELRIVQNDDMCFLVEKRMMWAEMIKERLDNEKIPCEYIGSGIGLALKMGTTTEYFRIYVPYGHYQRALEIIHQMFGNE